MLSRHDLLTRHPDVAYRTVGGHAVAVRPPTINQPATLLTLNETATAIWDLVDGATPLQVLLAHVAALYPEAPAERLEAETLAFVQQLLDAGVLVTHQETA